MTAIPIIRGPDPRLLQVSRPVNWGTDAEALYDLRDTFNDMKGRAWGLSACQIGHMIRAIWVKGIGRMVNPVVTLEDDMMLEAPEECLSYPWLKGVKVVRSRAGLVKFELGDQRAIESRFEGLTWRCVLHEIDHLNGITIETRRRKRLA